MKIDLEMALKTIKYHDSTGGNPIPDLLQFSYIDTNKNEIFKIILSQIESKTYKASPLLKIDVPKANYTIRPMARPEIIDWIVYQALIDSLIIIVDGKLSDKSYSAIRLFNNRHKTRPFLLFDDKSREYYANGYKFVVVADISSYYENIELEELRAKLHNYATSYDHAKEKIDFLFNIFLRPWSEGRINGFGLPQGPEASRFLGEVYLDSLDREMSSYDGYIRFMDDIRIFCKSEIEARRALIYLTKALRKYKLSLNSKKTKILKKKKIEKDLFDPKKPLLDACHKAAESKNLEQIKAITPILVNDIFLGAFSDNDNFNQRHINFATYKISMVKSSGIDFDEKQVIETIKNNFYKKPQHAKEFCFMLAMYPYNEEIKNFLLEFIFSDYNIYDGQELYVLRTLLEMRVKLTSTEVSKLWTRLKNKNLHWSLRALYTVIIGKFGDTQDRDMIKDNYDNNDIQELKIAFVLAVQELANASKIPFYTQIKDQFSHLKFIDYVKSLKNPMYLRTPRRVKIEEFNTLQENDYF